MLWLIALLFVGLYVIGQKTPATSTTSTPGADEGVNQPTEAETVTKPDAAKTIKSQKMNNATMHTVVNGTKDIDLGSITHSGELKSIKLIAKAKEQGYGTQCSSLHLNIMRGDKNIVGTVQSLGRTKEYKEFVLNPDIEAGTLVRAGDSIRMTINGWYPACATWIKDIVAEIKVLA